MFRKRRPKSDRRGKRTAGERECARRFLHLLKLGADLRGAKVVRLRRSIEQGSYENDLKLKIAADRLIDSQQ